ncbi:MAG: iron-containing redox enzyme family protein [Hyalangium sp.]|uniref:iron-containing redox enzyme family protein n=1 Tax=Hyalangium sp. TaxID=2028555 RepID=UPI003899F1CE
MLAIQEYVSSPAFRLSAAMLPPTPWHRPFRAQDLPALDITKPLRADELTSNRSLMLHRILLNIYEQSMLFLPRRRLGEEDMAAFRTFYDTQSVSLGQTLRANIERAAFSCLDEEVKVTGQWDWERLEDYLVGVIKRYESEPCGLTARIEAQNDPPRALKYLLIQQASDFLSEASAMARAMLGNYGPVQSELMKVFIDEYGYGVHSKKHSTLFESCCTSVGLSPEAHTYYFHYLPSSLALTNYFHYICSNKNLWFRYIGALYYTEASIPHFNQAMSKSLKGAFGRKVDTAYFDEHVHIDKHHRRMVLDTIIKPTIEMHGPQVIPEILIGFESFRLLQGRADQDYLEQVSFIESLEQQRGQGLHADAASYESAGDAPLTHTEPAGELSFAHIHDDDELFSVEKGALEFFAGLDPIVLEAGSSIVIPAGRLHGTRVLGDTCTYRVQKIRRRK